MSSLGVKPCRRERVQLGAYRLIGGHQGLVFVVEVALSEGAKIVLEVSEDAVDAGRSDE